MENFHWTCLFCNRSTTIHSELSQSETVTCRLDNDLGAVALKAEFFVCPIESCKKLTLKACLFKHYPESEELVCWDLIPQSNAKVFPEYIPQQLRNDYSEASAILKLSPKASATLARRCLQGMIRDFWKINNKRRLIDEIDAIKEKVDPLTWQAIEAVRKVGNIGAHMEKDVDLIIDVDPDEAEQLIGLIEMLFAEWYVNRFQREERLLRIQQIGADKSALIKAGKESASV
jgi:hypothetical protein